MPLPPAEIQAFALPSVEDGVLTQPIRVRGEVHGFSAPVSIWVAAARDILKAGRRRSRKPINHAEAAASGRVLTKPNGTIS